jgi:hypothetical protein
MASSGGAGCLAGLGSLRKACCKTRLKTLDTRETVEAGHEEDAERGRWVARVAGYFNIELVRGRSAKSMGEGGMGASLAIYGCWALGGFQHARPLPASSLGGPVTHALACRANLSNMMATPFGNR